MWGSAEPSQQQQSTRHVFLLYLHRQCSWFVHSEYICSHYWTLIGIPIYFCWSSNNTVFSLLLIQKYKCIIWSAQCKYACRCIHADVQPFITLYCLTLRIHTYPNITPHYLYVIYAVYVSLGLRVAILTSRPIHEYSVSSSCLVMLSHSSFDFDCIQLHTISLIIQLHTYNYNTCIETYMHASIHPFIHACSLPYRSLP